MDTVEQATFRLRTADTILDQVEEMYDFVTKRAFEIFLCRGGSSTLSIEDWLAAEKEVLWKPEVRVIEKNRQLLIEVPLGRTPPHDMEVLVTPGDMLLQTPDSDGAKRVFRTLRFPREIDIRTVAARYSSGNLVLIAATIPNRDDAAHYELPGGLNRLTVKNSPQVY